MRPDGPDPWTQWTTWRALDTTHTRVTRLRAWSGITGWRFESSSAHSRKPRRCGVFFVPGLVTEPRGRTFVTPAFHTWGTPVPHSPPTGDRPVRVHFDRG